MDRNELFNNHSWKYWINAREDFYKADKYDNNLCNLIEMSIREGNKWRLIIHK